MRISAEDNMRHVCMRVNDEGNVSEDNVSHCLLSSRGSLPLQTDRHMVKHKIDTVQKPASLLLSSNLHLCVCMRSRRETELYFKHL